jgi:hypothetical protein
MEGWDRQRRRRQPAGVGGPGDGVAELHLCPDCGSDLVHPLDWTPLDAFHWHVALRCPECEWRTEGTYEQSVLNRFDQVLDAGTDALRSDLRRLERMNMEAELRRFRVALGEDLVLPEDF